MARPSCSGTERRGGAQTAMAALHDLVGWARVVDRRQNPWRCLQARPEVAWTRVLLSSERTPQPGVVAMYYIPMRNSRDLWQASMAAALASQVAAEAACVGRGVREEWAGVHRLAHVADDDLLDLARRGVVLDHAVDRHDRCVVGLGRVSLLAELDTWHSKPYRVSTDIFLVQF